MTDRGTARSGWGPGRGGRAIAAWACLLLAWAIPGWADETLTELRYRITGQTLEVTPAALAIPKGIPGSFLPRITGGEEAAAELAARGFVEATLRGPSFPARRIVGQANAPILLPPLNLSGDYRLDNIRLVDGKSGETLLEGNPPGIPVQVFDEVLVARVTSRPLTGDEIKEKGIFIDESNFRAIEFEVGFVVDGKAVPVKFPVITPAFFGRREIIPAAELEERLAAAEVFNEQLSESFELPPELEGSGLNIQVKGLNVQFVDPGDGVDLNLQIPPIAGLMVIPGEIGFRNQFFSVQVFVENAAPAGSGLSVAGVTAEVVLPFGPDRVPGESFENPGDDPLRFARVGPDKEIFPVLPVMRPGPDGVGGTEDDVERLQPGEAGQAEFLVEGLQEGLHVMDVLLKGRLEGLVAGSVEVEGRAAGSVLVRNPNFSLAFSHPRTIRAGEPYNASVTILNTSSVAADQVSITLPPASVTGALLESEATVLLGDIAPGETRTAEYRLRAQRTGSITFSNLTGDDDVVGRFRLRMGVDERGVELSPDSIGYPDFVQELPVDLLTAADRVLGQALSVATAGQVPLGVLRVNRKVITSRVVELAEAGQRLRYGDSLERVAADLLLDWQGGRKDDPGFDQILRETDAGREWRDALAALIGIAAPDLSAPEFLAQRARDAAARGEAWWLAASEDAALPLQGILGGAAATSERSEIEGAAVYEVLGGSLLAGKPFPGMTVQGIAAEDFAGMIELAMLNGAGGGMRVAWEDLDLPAGAVVAFDPGAIPVVLRVDRGGDGVFEQSLAGLEEFVVESPPEVLTVVQDTTIVVGRPANRCTPNPYNNYGTVVAVLYNKPMSAEGAAQPEFYAIDGDIRTGSAALQPGGRVVLLNLEEGIGAYFERDLTIAGVADPRGALMPELATPVETTATEGFFVNGRVVRADGSPAINVPVTLGYIELVGSACMGSLIRPAQVRTDEAGRFDLDFVLSGPEYVLSATDTAGLPEEAVSIILQANANPAATRDKLLDLATRPEVRDVLLRTFRVDALPQAVVLAEGLDRAVFYDLVAFQSNRTGTEVPVALRFRGRGTVTGRVREAADGAGIADAAVNLFPDPASRELGRGILTDPNGNFAFFGVPLGPFSVEAAAPDGRFRVISEFLERPGEEKLLVIELGADPPTPRGTLAGRVVEADGKTPHPGARVLVGRLQEDRIGDVVASVQAGGEGLWETPEIPVGIWDVAAVSVDGNLRGTRKGIAVEAAMERRVTVALQSRATVRGRVEFADGRPAANAIVAGGIGLVRTDAHGNFVLEGVPVGRRTISAGLERDPAAGIAFPRIGSAMVQVVAGSDLNFVVIRFDARGSITGRVLNVAGNAVPGEIVALPLSGESFAWTETNGQGVYLFENIGLRDYTVSAPGPAVADNDLSEELAVIGRGLRGDDEVMQEDLIAAVTEAFAVFTGVNDPFLTGGHENFNPRTWGFARTSLKFDGQTAVADIVYLPEGTVSGVVLNGRGTPVGARVRLTGLGPSPAGDVSVIIRGERNSDPATGVFEFAGQLLAGPYGVQAASPFSPVVVRADGQTTRLEPDVSGIVLQFPDEENTAGRLVGTVLLPDGTLAADVAVRIGFGDDFVIRTDEAGRFDSRIDLPALGSDRRPGRTYQVEAAEDFQLVANQPPVAIGKRGQTTAIVMPGQVNECTVQLLDFGSLEVEVVFADGSPAGEALVELRQTTFPFDQFDGMTGLDGQIVFQELFEGSYAAGARKVLGQTGIRAAAGAVVLGGQNSSVRLMLQPTGSIRGRFVDDDGATPVSFAQVLFGNSVGVTSTDEDGDFLMEGLPLGVYRLIGSDPVTGRLATAQVQIASADAVAEVLLRVRPLGEVRGLVINSNRDGTVAGAEVTLTPQDGLSAARTVTTGPDGAFSFPGALAGAFRLNARDIVSGAMGSTEGMLPAGVGSVDADVALEPRGALRVRVFEADGETRAAGVQATVFLGGDRSVSGETGDEGEIVFSGLGLTDYRIVGRSLLPERDREGGVVSAALTQAGAEVLAEVFLLGIGRVEGVVRSAGDVLPAEGVTVRLTSESVALGSETRVAVTGADGRFVFENVAVGNYRVDAALAALGVSENGRIDGDGEEDALDLTLSPSGSVLGRLVRVDGSPAPGVPASVFFDAPSGALGVAVDFSDEDGTFRLDSIPLGEFRLEALDPENNAVAVLRSQLFVGGEEKDLGNVVLDEDDLRVEAVDPADGTADFPADGEVRFFFQEAVDPESFNEGGVFLSLDGEAVEAELSVEQDEEGVARIIRVHPLEPLESERTYDAVVLDGDRVLTGVGNNARGPRDLVGRPLVTPFQSRFTTVDSRPPALLSFTPENGSTHVAIESVVRLSFDEAIDPAGIVVTLTGPGGVVAGETAVGVDGRVVVFTPARNLLPNALYEARISGISDRAGNFSEGQPFVSTFGSLDTLGPVIAELRLKDGALPASGAAVEVEAVLAQPEDGVRLRLTANLLPAGETVVPGDLDLPFILPLEGVVTFRAVAIDGFGNQGPLAEHMVLVQVNEPPVLQLVRLNPAAGPVKTGTPFTLQLLATDDSGVAQVKGALGGAASLPLQTTADDRLNLASVVRANAGLGESIVVVGEAVDTSGSSSGEVRFSIPIEDGTPPSVSVLGPAAGLGFGPGAVLTLQVEAVDNFGVSNLAAEVSGAFTASLALLFPPRPGAVVAPFDIAIPEDATADGREFTVSVTGRDDAGLISAPAQRTFRVSDSTPPKANEIFPADGSDDAPLLPVITAVFSEALDPAFITAETVRLTDPGFVAGLVSLDPDGRTVRFVPDGLLTPAESYVFGLSGDILGVDGNRIEPAQSGFTVTDFAVDAPEDASKAVEGAETPFRVETANPQGVARIALHAEGEDFGELLPPDFEGDVRLPLLADLGPAPHRFGARVEVPHGLQLLTLELDPVTLDLRPRAADDDGDGIDNGKEADAGTDPFRPDLDEDIDGDGLTNGEELALGTSPVLADSDQDGLEDGAEVALGSDPLLADTDGDGIPDGEDPFPLIVDRAPAAVDDLVEAQINEPVDIPVADLLANDSDPDGDAFAFAGFTPPVHGTVTQESAQILRYTPPPGFSGADTFTYTIAARGKAAVATVTVTVQAGGENRAPVAVDDFASTVQGLQVLTENLLLNDFDPDEDLIAIASFTQPLHGTVTHEGAGRFLYAPSDPLFFGTDAFTYTITDGFVESLPATVSVDVAPSSQRIWTNANGGNWNDPANWMNNEIPGPDDLAVIALPGDYEVTLNADVTVAQLRLGGEAAVAPVLRLNGRTLTLRGGGTVFEGAALRMDGDGRITVQNGNALTIRGVLDWEGGTITAGGRVIVGAGAVGNLTTGSGKFIDGVLENRGTMNYTGTGLLFGRDGPNLAARLENTAGAVLVVDGEGDFSNNHGSPSYVVENAGTLIKRGAGTTTAFSGVRYVNLGTLLLESGLFRFTGDATLGGTIESAGGQLVFQGGTQTLPAGAELDQAALALTNTTLILEAGSIYNFTSLDLNASTLVFNEDYELETLLVRGDGRVTMQDESVLTVTGLFDWEGGTITAGGRVVVETGAVGNLTTGSGKFIDGVLENRGTLNYTGTGLLFGRDGPNLEARLENKAGAVLVVDGEGDFSNNHGSPSYVVENAGTFIKRGAGTTTTFSGVRYVNLGTLLLESGLFRFTGDATLGGTIESAGGQLVFQGGTQTLPAGAELDQAALTLTSTTLILEAGSIYNFTSLDLNASALVFNEDYELETLLIRGDGRVTMQDESVLTVTGLFDWEGGTITAGGRVVVETGAVGNLTTGSGKFIDGVLENRGTLNYTGTGLLFGRDGPNLEGRLENKAGAVLVVDGEGDFSNNHGSPSYVVENAGTLIKRGAGTTTTFSGVRYVNLGTLLLESGLFRFTGDATLGGTIESAGGQLVFQGGTQTLPTGAELDQAALALTNTTLILEAGSIYNFTSLDLNASALVFNEDYELETLLVRGDGRVTMQDESVLTVTGLFDWEGGTITAGGRVLVSAGAVGNLTTGSGKFIDGVLENRGTMNYTGTGLLFGRDGPNLAARLENTAGAVLVVDGEGDFSNNHGSPSYVVENAGTLIKRGAGTTTAFSGVRYVNLGTLLLESGLFRFTGDATLGGTIESAGGQLVFQGGTQTLPAGAELDQAALTLTSTTLILEAGSIYNFTSLDLNASTLVFNEDYELETLLVRGDGRVTMQDENVLTVTGLFDWEGGTITAGGRVVVEAGAVGNLTTGSGKFIDGVLENRGTLNYTGTGLLFGRDGPNLAARLENKAGAVLVVDGEGDFSNNHGSPSYVVENAGVFAKQGIGTTTSFSGVAFATTGTVSGSGILGVNLTNTGVLRPDPVPGGLTIQGTFTQTASGRTELGLAGPDAVLGHRSLTVTGAATLGGTLAVILQNPFAEPQNAQFTVLSYASRSGDFAAFEGLTQSGYTLTPVAGAGAYELLVTQEGQPPAQVLSLLAEFERYMGAAESGHALDPDCAPLADLDGDGWCNWLEFAMGTDPDDPADFCRMDSRWMRVGSASVFEIRFERKRWAGMLPWGLSWSDDMRVWQAVPAGSWEEEREPAAGAPGRETVRWSIPAPHGGERYFRIALGGWEEWGNMGRVSRPGLPPAGRSRR